jgi:hypothetical protein
MAKAKPIYLPSPSASVRVSIAAPSKGQRINVLVFQHLRTIMRRSSYRHRRVITALTARSQYSGSISVVAKKGEIRKTSCRRAKTFRLLGRATPVLRRLFIWYCEIRKDCDRCTLFRYRSTIVTRRCVIKFASRDGRLGEWCSLFD